MRASIFIGWCLAAQCSGAEPAPFEGTLVASLERGGSISAQYRYTRVGNQLRIENLDPAKLEPINLLDLSAGKLTLVFPHNSSYVRIDLNKPAAAAGVPGPPAMPAAPQPPGGRPGPVAPPPAGFPTPPPMPQLPNNPAAGAGAGMPMMPPMPAMMPRTIPELKKTDKTRTIQGFECSLYTMGDRMEIFEIWATSDAALFPFRLLQRHFSNRHFGPQQLEEQWMEALRKKSLFPLEATLRMEGGGADRYSFKITKIEKRPAKAEQSPELFAVPQNYFEIEPPAF